MHKIEVFLFAIPLRELIHDNPQAMIQQEQRPRPDLWRNPAVKGLGNAAGDARHGIRIAAQRDRIEDGGFVAVSFQKGPD